MYTLRCLAKAFISQTLSTIFKHYNLFSFLCFYLSHVEFKFFSFKYVAIGSTTLAGAA